MATGATEFIDSTTADVFIPEVWSRLAILAREQALVFARLVDRRFEDELKAGDTIHVPSRTHLTAQTKTKASNAAIVYETQTETNTDITVATWEYVAVALETIVKVQANRDMMEFYAPEMGYALALAVDDVLAGLVDDFSNTVGTLTAETTDAEYIRARQYLNDANAPMDDRAIIIAPAAESGLLKLDRYVNNDYSAIHGDGARETAQEKAYVTSFYRMPVYVSTNVEGTNAAGHDNGMFHRHALALVMQEKPKTYPVTWDPDYLVWKVVMEQLYGSREMRDDHGCFIQGA